MPDDTPRIPAPYSPIGLPRTLIGTDGDYLIPNWSSEPAATLGVTKLESVQMIPTELYNDLMANVMAATLAGPPPTAEQQEQWRREREQNAADARAEWQALRDRLTGNAPALAVLDLHHPTDGGYYCAWSEDDEWDTDWPCGTVEAIRDALPEGKV